MYDFEKEAVRDEDGFLMAGRALTLVKNYALGDAGYIGNNGRRVVGYFRPVCIGNQPQILHGKEGEDVFYGFEMEYSGVNSYGSNKPEKFSNLRKDKGVENTIFSYHTDGSLSNGYEVVTSPMSLPFIRKYGFEWMKGMVRDFKSIGATSRGAGLHIHVSRTIGEDIVEKVRGEILSHKVEWKKASGRNEFYFAKIDEDFDSHYNFFGNSYHHPTYEFRLFKGTTLVNVFASRVEAFFALLYWAKNEKVLPFHYWLYSEVEGMENNIGVKYLRKFLTKPTTPFVAPVGNDKVYVSSYEEIIKIPLGTKLTYEKYGVNCELSLYNNTYFFVSDNKAFDGNQIPTVVKKGYLYSHTVKGFFDFDSNRKLYYYK